MPGKGKIAACHNNVATELSGILDVAAEFRPWPTNWSKVKIGTEIGFDLVPCQPADNDTTLRTTRRVSVFPLTREPAGDVDMFWVSWDELWQKREGPAYHLLGAGWTLFKGFWGVPQKTQVLRAEWDQLPDKGSKDAGQPHWHVDQPLYGRKAGEREIRPGLVEAPVEMLARGWGQDEAEAASESLKRFHLAMGTWDDSKDHPGCWQRSYEQDCRKLEDWCVKTLKYLKDQVKHR